jgi:cell wall-associated NlpC family hydrolase
MTGSKIEYPFFITVLLTVSLFIFASCNNDQTKNFQKEIDSISAHIVPDKRLGICSVIVEKGKDGALILRGESTETEAKNQIINTLDRQGIILIDSIIDLPDTTTNKKYSGLVTLSVINLRKEPDHRSELVSQSIMGTPVRILKNDGMWCLIQTPDKYIAWTENSSLTTMNNSEMSRWKKSERIIYIMNTGWIQKDASDDSGVIGDLVAGSILEKDGESKSYIKVKLPDGRQGYIARKEVNDFNEFRNRPQSGGAEIVKTAISMLGIPYLWGGSSTKGADCSGFVQTVYFLNGIILQRDASLQALHGIPLEISKDFKELQEGDLLFFGTGKDSEQKITHVAIYMGDNEYINSSGRVMINSLDPASANFNSHRLNSILSARRIIGIENDPGIISLKNHYWY